MLFQRMGKRLTDAEAREVMIAAGLEPLEPYKGNNVLWKCKCLECGETVEPSRGNIKRGGGCNYCGYRKAGTALRLTDAEAREVMIAAGLEPLEPYKGNNVPWKCKCLECGETVEPSRGNIKRGGGCNYCGYRKAGTALRLTDAEAREVMIAAGLEPLEPYKGSNGPWKCRCLKCGRSVSPARGAIQGGGGCIYCSGKKVDEEEAVKAMCAAGVEPQVPYPGRSDEPWECKCLKCGRTVSPTWDNVKQSKRGCIYCSGRKVDEEEVIATMRDKGLEPLEPYKRAEDPWKCKCLKCGKTVTPRWSSIKQDEGGCIYCAGIKVDEKEAVAAMRAASLEPLVPYPGADEPWECKCLKCGRTVAPSRSNIKKGQGSCKYCAEHGFDLTQPATVYFIEHPEKRALKVGVTGDAAKQNRLSYHERCGWNIIQTWNCADGSQAFSLEKKVLDYWRTDLGAPMFLRASDMPDGGWTETVDSLAVDVEATIALIEDHIKSLDR
jgi:hypothetical protein